MEETDKSKRITADSFKRSRTSFGSSASQCPPQRRVRARSGKLTWGLFIFDDKLELLRAKAIVVDIDDA